MYISHMAAALEKIDKKIQEKARRAGRSFERIWVGLQRGPKTGRFYRIGKTPTKADRAAGRNYRSHQASATGEAPAVMYGKLIKSMRQELHHDSLALWRVRVSWNAYYLKYLEFGTSRMDPRPSVRPALRILKDQMRAIMEREHGEK